MLVVDWQRNEYAAVLAELPPAERATCERYLDVLGAWGDRVMNAYEPPPEEPKEFSAAAADLKTERFRARNPLRSA